MGAVTTVSSCAAVICVDSAPLRGIKKSCLQKEPARICPRPSGPSCGLSSWWEMPTCRCEVACKVSSWWCQTVMTSWGGIWQVLLLGCKVHIYPDMQRRFSVPVCYCMLRNILSRPGWYKRTLFLIDNAHRLGRCSLVWIHNWIFMLTKCH